MEETIAKNGYFIQSVHGDGDRTGWSYTIGLEDEGPGELLVTGMHHGRAHRIITDLIEKVRSGSLSWPEHGTTLTDVLPDYELRVVRVEVSAECEDYLLGAVRRRERLGRNDKPLLAFQLVWEDEGHGWTFAGTDEQPLLGPGWW